MNFFRVNLRASIFFHVIFPCANIIFCTSPAPQTNKVSNGLSVSRHFYEEMLFNFLSVTLKNSS